MFSLRAISNFLFIVFIFSTADFVLAEKACDLYPLTIDNNEISGLTSGERVNLSLDANGPGNYGWLTWNGGNSAGQLAISLTPPGDGLTYVNPDDAGDKELNVGDYVQGLPGIKNSTEVRAALDALLLTEIHIPLWSNAHNAGANYNYFVDSFAVIKLVSFELKPKGYIEIEYLRQSSCYNNRPETQDTIVQTLEDEKVEFDLPASDADGDELEYFIKTSPEYGDLSFNEGKAFFTPNPNFNGNDSFVFYASDGLENSENATVSIAVNSVNDHPVIDSSPVPEVNKNDLFQYFIQATDPDGDILVYSIQFGPNGLQIDEDSGELNWNTGINDVGVHLVVVQVSDGELSVDFTFLITVINNNTAPVSMGINIIGSEDEPEEIVLSSVDAEGDSLGYTLLGEPQYGQLGGTPPNLIYTPNPNYNGADSFTYLASDLEFDSNVATVLITVEAVNDTPIAISGSFETSENQSVLVELSGADVDGDELTYQIASAPLNGVLSGEMPNITYTPNSGFYGEDEFEFRVSDGIDYSEEKIITITVERVVLDMAEPEDQVNRIADQVDLPVLLENPESHLCSLGLPPDLVVDKNASVITGELTEQSLGVFNVGLASVDKNSQDYVSFGLSHSTRNRKPGPVHRRILGPGVYLVTSVSGAWNYSLNNVSGCNEEGRDCGLGWQSGFDFVLDDTFEVNDERWESIQLASQNFINYCFTVEEETEVSFYIPATNWSYLRGEAYYRIYSVNNVSHFSWTVQSDGVSQPRIISTAPSNVLENKVYEYEVTVEHPNSSETLVFGNKGYEESVSIDSLSGMFLWNDNSSFPVYSESIDEKCYAPVSADSEYLNASNWEIFREQGAHADYQRWVIREGGLLIEADGNGDLSGYVSPQTISDEALEFQFETGSIDDDLYGFIWGFQNEYNMYRLAWRRSGGLNVGLEVWKVEGGVAESIYTSPIRWANNSKYKMLLDLKPGKATIFVLNGETNDYLDVFQIVDSTYLSGRFGYLAISQPGIKYRSRFIDREVLPDLIVKDLMVSAESSLSDKISLVVMNRGSITSEETDLLVEAGDFDLSGQFVVGKTFPAKGVVSLPSGEEQTFELNVQEISENFNVLRATVDTLTRNVVECNESNNTRLMPVMNVKVTDSSGDYDSQKFGVPVLNVNDAPEVLSEAPEYAFAGEVWEYNILAFDKDLGDHLSNEIILGPGNATFKLDSSLYLWTPELSDLGKSVRAVVRYTDLEGLHYDHEFSVEVHQRPEIISSPNYTAYNGEVYIYDVDAVDQDGDILTYSLVDSPDGMVIDEASGVITWEASNMPEIYLVSVKVDDGRSGVVIQEYLLSVLESGEINNLPSLASNNPKKYAYQNELYSYTFEVYDVDGASPIFSLLEAPDGMVIDKDTGQVWWYVPFTPKTNHTVVVQVYDQRGGFDSFEYSINLLGQINGIPEIYSLPETNYQPDLEYSYQILATDPENELLTYSLLEAPFGARISLSGLLSWDIPEGTSGLKRISIEVKDPYGNSSTQKYTLTDQSNSTPFLISVPGPTAAVDNYYTYQLIATDLDGDAIEFSLSDYPEGMSVDSLSGIVSWIPSANQVGFNSVSIRVSDGQAYFDQSFVIEVLEEPLPLGLVIDISPAVIDEGDDSIVQLLVENAIGNISIEGTLNSEPISFDENNQAVINGALVGSYLLSVTIDDGRGPVVQERTLFVRDPADSSNPEVQINTMVNGQRVTAPTSIIGTVSDANIHSYSLSYKRISDEEIHEIASGNSNVDNVEIGIFDPTGLMNGTYIINLTATDLSGNQSEDNRTIVVDGDFKVGNFSFLVEDLNIPLEGIPIQVTRTYDSRRKRESLDFGFGWSIDYQNVLIEESSEPTEGWYQDQRNLLFDVGESQNIVLEGTCTSPFNLKTVSVTLPDGELEEFGVRAHSVAGGIQSISDPNCYSVAGRYFQLRFDPKNDTFSTLEPLEDVQYYLTNVDSGQLAFDVTETSAYPISRYKLTTRSGYQYELNEDFGIEKVITPNGHTLTYSESGITHSSGKSISFSRNSQGVVEEIIAPNGSSLVYDYNLTGDLKSVTDQVNATTNYIYNNDHGLLDISDPLGRPILKNIYDDDGRLIAQEDGEGNRKDFTHLIDERSSVVTDRDGRTTVFNYDDEGKVTEEVVLISDGSYTADITTSYDYDANGNETSKTIGDTEHTWTSEYNSNNDMLYAIDPEGNRVDYLAYNSLGQETQIQDEMGRVTEMAYDSAGNLTSINMPEYFDPQTQTQSLVTLSASNVVNTNGQVESTTDLRGNTTSYTYYPSGHASAGQKRTESNAESGTVTLTYDINNNVRTETRERTVNGSVILESLSYEYDARDRLTKTIYPDGSYSETIYDLAGNVEQDRDRFGVWTEYGYDAYGRLTETVYADGSSESSTYTKEGLLETVTDALGHTTAYEYDDAGRQWKVIFHDQTYTETRYTPQGWVQYQWDEKRNLTEYEYDLAGKRTAVIRHYTDAEGNAQTQSHSFSYYDNGELHTETDANGHVTTYILNALDQRIETQFENGTTSETWYDAMGAKIRGIDQSQIGTDYRYDELGRLKEVQPDVEIEGVRTPITSYAYDEAGNKLTQTDAKGHTTSWTYDYFGRVLSRSLPEGMSESFVYVDGLGCTEAERSDCANAADPRTITHTDFNDDIIITAYDSIGRVARVDYSKDSTSESYKYYASGQLHIVNDQNGTTTYYYDDRDRLETEVRPGGKQIDYSYDDAGNRESVTVSRGLNVSSSTAYTYDALNRLETVIDSKGTTRYSYDAVGNLDAISYPNGLLTDYDYNTINQLTDVYTWNSSELTSHFNYGLLPTGRRETITELDGRITSYVYDGLYRLESESITDAENGNYQASYEYDWVGNRTYETVDGVQTAYEYDGNDRLEQSGGTTYAYDENGNTLSSTLDGITTTYQWDGRNRLASTTGTSGTASYTYNHSGIRTGKTENGVTTYFVVDENRAYAQVLEEVVDDAITVAYTYGHDLISQNRGAATSYYHYDGLGSTRALSDASGSLTDTYDYEAFGEVLNQTGTTENSYLFTGEQFDQTLNQYYLRARYYDQGVGRFTQMDTFDGVDLEPETLHKYSYVGNEPTNYVDFSGNLQSLTSTQLSLQINGILAVATIGPHYTEQTGLGIGTKAGSKCAHRIMLSKMGRYSKPVTEKDKQCDRELNQMRVQFQISPVSGGGVTLFTWAVPVLGPQDRGVAVVDMEVNMTALFYSRPTGASPNGWPRSLDTQTIKLMSAQSKYMRKFPPFGITGRTSHSETFDSGRYQYRIDVENIRGTNLQHNK